MDLTGRAAKRLAGLVERATAVVPVGARTHWEVGGPPAPATEVRAPGGVVEHEPAELTITVGAGLTAAALADVLAEAGQECPLDPREPGATVGGVLATGLSGPRRLRYGPLRDRVLEVRFVTARGRLVKGGGPTVKNVTGYDLPRLLVGSLGTIGVLVQVTLRCQARPRCARWFAGVETPDAVRRRLFRPSSVLWDGATTRVLLEGDPEDVEAEARRAGLEPGGPAPWPDGPHRGRVSVPPSRLAALGAALDGSEGISWLAEAGVGTVHVGAATATALAEARRRAEVQGGWLLREAGAAELHPFGAVHDRALQSRVRRAFDPDGKLSPGRVPW